MSMRNSLIGLGVSVGLGLGTFYALDRQEEKGREVARIEACASVVEGEAVEIERLKLFCEDTSPIRAEAEVIEETRKLFFAGGFALGIGSFLIGISSVVGVLTENEDYGNEGGESGAVSGDQ